MAIGVGLAAFQILPALEWLPRSAAMAQRSAGAGVGDDVIGQWRTWIEMAALVLPNAFNNPTWPHDYKSFLPWTNLNELTGYFGVRSYPVQAYAHAAGTFRKNGNYWVELRADGSQVTTFQEESRDGEHIYAVDASRHAPGDPSRRMYLRIPIAGGMTQWSFANPFIWQDLYPVSPQR